MERDEQRRPGALGEHALGRVVPDQVPLADRRLDEARGAPGVGVQRRAAVVLGPRHVVLLDAQADVRPGLRRRDVARAPGLRELPGEPRVRGLRDRGPGLTRVDDEHLRRVPQVP